MHFWVSILIITSIAKCAWCLWLVDRDCVIMIMIRAVICASMVGWLDGWVAHVACCRCKLATLYFFFLFVSVGVCVGCYVAKLIWIILCRHYFQTKPFVYLCFVAWFKVYFIFNLIFVDMFNAGVALVTTYESWYGNSYYTLVRNACCEWKLKYFVQFFVVCRLKI